MHFVCFISFICCWFLITIIIIKCVNYLAFFSVDVSHFLPVWTKSDQFPPPNTLVLPARAFPQAGRLQQVGARAARANKEDARQRGGDPAGRRGGGDLPDARTPLAHGLGPGAFGGRGPCQPLRIPGGCIRCPLNVLY